ncbi:MAG: ATP-binding protein [Elainellaceae cyanobacterium]
MVDHDLSSIQLLQRQAASLLLYQTVLEGAVGEAFLRLLQALEQRDASGISGLRAYGDWFKALASENVSWQTWILLQILRADNPFTRQVQQTSLTDLPPALVAAVQHDLRTLQTLYRCDSQKLSQWVQSISGIAPTPWVLDAAHVGQVEEKTLRAWPIWNQFETIADWATLVEPLANHHRQFGSGQFASYRAFRWQADQLVGVAHPDPIQLEELVGYEIQKATLVQNTEALLAGYTALHVLLYGSRGSGKSSLVKALLHRYWQQGLRLIEVSKANLNHLPAIVNSLRQVPQKFIIFVDDLSFEEDDDAYKALKVVLEGNITARPQNVVVYATSNRRHLIREFFGDRPRPSDADEIHAWDTVQEKLSFSDRFGLTLTFEPADQTTYLEIVQHLAQLAAIPLGASELEFRALQWATRHNGRSGRTARQFIDSLQAELGLSAPKL